jgi:hypothetical protein
MTSRPGYCSTLPPRLVAGEQLGRWIAGPLGSQGCNNVRFGHEHKKAAKTGAEGERLSVKAA